jgi:hypothetical protein
MLRQQMSGGRSAATDVDMILSGGGLAEMQQLSRDSSRETQIR